MNRPAAPDIERLQVAVREAPQQAGLRLELAEALLSLGRDAEAEQNFQWILERAPDDARALWGLARLAREQQRSSALDYLRRAVAAEPGNERVRLALGDMLVTRDRLDEAAQIFRNLLDCADVRVGALIGLGRIALKRGHPQAALERFQQAQTLAPAHPPVLLAIASALSEAGDTDGASQLCEQVLLRKPHHARALIQLARMARWRGSSAHLVPRLEAAANEQPDHEALVDELSRAKWSARHIDWKSEIGAARAALRQSAAPAGATLRAASTLLRYGVVDGIEDALRPLTAAYATAPRLIAQARQLRRSGMAQPAPGNGTDTERDTFREPTGVIDKTVPGASRLLVFFAGQDAGMLLTFELFHRLLRPLGVSAIYLRDLEASAYFAGIPGLGPDLRSSIAALRSLIARSGASRVSMISYCNGTFGALRYGLELGVESILALGPRSRIAGAHRRPEIIARLAPWREREPHFSRDPGELYAEATQQPRLTLIYGEDCVLDANDALAMRDVPGATLIPIAGTSAHNCLALLLGAGVFGSVLRTFAAEGALPPELIERVRQAATQPRASPEAVVA